MFSRVYILNVVIMPNSHFYYKHEPLLLYDTTTIVITISHFSYIDTTKFIRIYLYFISNILNFALPIMLNYNESVH